MQHATSRVSPCCVRVVRFLTLFFGKNLLGTLGQLGLLRVAGAIVVIYMCRLFSKAFQGSGYFFAGRVGPLSL